VKKALQTRLQLKSFRNNKTHFHSINPKQIAHEWLNYIGNHYTAPPLFKTKSANPMHSPLLLKTSRTKSLLHSAANNSIETLSRYSQQQQTAKPTQIPKQQPTNLLRKANFKQFENKQVIRPLIRKN